MMRWTKRKDSWRVKEEHVLVHVVIFATSLTWARPKEKSQQTQRKEKERKRERRKQTRQGEERASLPIAAARISRRRLLGERDAAKWRRRGGFLLQHAVSCHCAVAPSAIQQEPYHSSHTFFRIYLPIGWVYQSLAANVRRRGFGAAIAAAFVVFPWWIRGPSNSSSTMIAEYLMDNSVLGWVL